MEVKKFLSNAFEIGKMRLCSPKILGICIGLWVLFQIIYVSVYLFRENLGVDEGRYVYFAMECVKHGTMYPDYSNFYNEFIHAPGWINFLILWIKLFGSVYLIPYFNILLNIVVLYLLYKIAYKVTANKNITYLALYLFIFLPANAIIVLNFYTEIPFEILSLLSFYLVFSKKYWLVLLAGICIALAQWIRPLGVAWMLAAIFFMLYKDKRIKHAIIYVVGVVFTCGSIGIATHRNFPTYVFQSTTGSINVLLGANDMATGASVVDALRSPEGLGYLPGLYSENEYIPVRDWRTGEFMHKYSNKYTYLECDSIYKARAIQWIKENPGRWCLLIPKKIYFLFYTTYAYIMMPDPINASFTSKIIWVICKITSRSFVLMVLCALVGLLTPFWKDKKLIYVVIPIVVCSAMTVATFGDPRFNFIIIPFILIFCCYSLKYYKNKYID